MGRWAAGLIAGLCWCPMALAGPRPSVRLDVPFLKQEKNGCGAAAIAMLMQYWQQLGEPAAVDAREIQRDLYSREAHGIYTTEVERYLDEHGYRTFAFQGTWDDLQEQLEKGRPIIVALKAGRDDFHYVVVAGIDEQQGVLLKNDPAQRKLLKQRRASFEKEWKAAASWTLLAVPQGDVQASSR